MKSWIWGSVALVVAIVASLVAGVGYHHVDWLHAIVILFTFYGVALLCVPLLARRRAFLKNDCYRPFVTILIPARNEEFVIEATVRSLCKLHYRKNGKPNFEVLVVDDGSTDQTVSILNRLSQEFPMVRTLRRFGEQSGQGKSAALNDALQNSSGEIIAVFDADTRVEPNFLVKTVACLYDPKVGGVQGRVRIYNPRENALTAMQEDEFSVFAHLVQMAKDEVNGLTALGGNGQLTRRSSLEAVGGWNELSTTEDLDLTLRLLVKGFSVRYCHDAILWQEAVTTPSALLRQRVRWSEGFIKCFFDYFFPLMIGRLPFIKRMDGLLSLIRVLLPIWVLIGYLAVGAAFSAGMAYDSAIPRWLFISATAGFFLVTFVGIYKLQAASVLDTVVRVIRYWLYNFIWVVAVPIGFINCMRNFNTIKWDKTVHRGDLPLVPIPSVPALSYRQGGGASLAEVIE